MQKILEQGIALHQQGRLDEAWALYERVLQSDPGMAEALHLSGVICNLRGQHSEAARRIGLAIGSNPLQPYYYVNLGNAALELGQAAEAERAFRQAITLLPGLAAAHYNLANLLKKLGREDEAISAYDQAIVHEPGHLKALVALSQILLKRKHFDLCLTLLSRALAVDSADAEGLGAAAQVLYQLKRFEAANAMLDRLLAIVGDDASIFARKGDVLRQLYRFDEAIAAFRTALAIDPSNVDAIGGLGAALNNTGRTAEALATIQAGVLQHPESSELFSHYLFLLNYEATLSPQALARRHEEWEKRFCSDPAMAPLPFHANAPLPARRLKLGYVSADFRQHSVSFFIEPIIERHDRSNFEVFCYSSCQEADPVTERLRGKADAWRETAELDHQALAALIRRDGIDLLVDLSGHTGGNRLLCFARKPAPVQFTYLGYPNTTGLSAIDYRISDAVADPAELADQENSETVLRLPDCFHCYRGTAVPTNPTPAFERTGRITFGSFNVLSKISDDTLRAWSAILEQVPDARLLVKAHGLGETSAQDIAYRRFASFGIPPERLLLHGHDEDHAEHMQRYGEIDIALDTFPYNGTTTTCDALWMSVPVVSVRRDRHGARVGASLLHAVGLDELIADGVDDYVARAVALAGDSDRLQHLHRTLRARMQTSPLMDEARFVGNLERLYRTAWTDWCERQSRTQ